MTFESAAFHWFFLLPIVILVPAFLVLRLIELQGWLKTMRLMLTPVLMIVILAVSAMALSGCGTAPLQVQTSPPVPAGLLTPPRPPVLLQAPSRSTTPGATTPSTPSGAPKTGSTTSA